MPLPRKHAVFYIAYLLRLVKPLDHYLVWYLVLARFYIAYQLRLVKPPDHYLVLGRFYIAYLLRLVKPPDHYLVPWYLYLSTTRVCTRYLYWYLVSRPLPGTWYLVLGRFYIAYLLRLVKPPDHYLVPWYLTTTRVPYLVSRPLPGTWYWAGFTSHTYFD
jgi:hypothetical protein